MLLDIVDDRAFRLPGTAIQPDELYTLMAHPQLCELRIPGAELGDADMELIAALEHLRCLHLHDNPITSRGLPALARLEHLRELTLSYTRVSSVGLEGLTNLHTLRLSRTPLKNGLRCPLTHLSQCRRLRSLDLSLTDLVDDDLVPLTALSSLEKLNLSVNRLTDACLKVLRRLDRLRELDLTATRITATGWRMLEQMTGLRTLILAHGTRGRDIDGIQAVGDAPSVWNRGLMRLAGLGDLRVLDLSHTPVDDTGMTALAGMQHLRHLNLGSTGITDSSAAILARLRALEYLNLNQTTITDRGIAALCHLPNLEVLVLGGTQMTHRALACLTRLPKLRSLVIPRHGMQRRALAPLLMPPKMVAVTLDNGSLNPTPLYAGFACDYLRADRNVPTPTTVMRGAIPRDRTKRGSIIRTGGAGIHCPSHWVVDHPHHQAAGMLAYCLDPHARHGLGRLFLEGLIALAGTTDFAWRHVRTDTLIKTSPVHQAYVIVSSARILLSIYLPLNDAGPPADTCIHRIQEMAARYGKDVSFITLAAHTMPAYQHGPRHGHLNLDDYQAFMARRLAARSLSEDCDFANLCLEMCVSLIRRHSEESCDQPCASLLNNYGAGVG